MAAIELNDGQSFPLERERPLWKRAGRRALGISAVRQSYEYALLFKRLREETDPTLISLNREHGLRTMKAMEGYIDSEQAIWLKNALEETFSNARTIAQTGFNGGHSASVILGARPNITLTSFDLGEHAYVDQASEFIDLRFPDRHKLIIGDSQETLRDYPAETPFDLVFVDGGHSEEVALADLLNFADLSVKNGVVIMDDYLPQKPFGVGPYAAWNKAVRRGLITPLGHKTSQGRAWVYGTFNN